MDSMKSVSGENASLVKDPVCGMVVDPAQAEWTSEHKGQTYYFCAPGCKRQFERDPERYVGHERDAGHP